VADGHCSRGSTHTESARWAEEEARHRRVTIRDGHEVTAWATLNDLIRGHGWSFRHPQARVGNPQGSTEP
jgi:hypothetical protein